MPSWCGLSTVSISASNGATADLDAWRTNRGSAGSANGERNIVKTDDGNILWDMQPRGFELLDRPKRHQIVSNDENGGREVLFRSTWLGRVATALEPKIAFVNFRFMALLANLPLHRVDERLPADAAECISCEPAI